MIQPLHAINTPSLDARVNAVRMLARQLRDNAELTPELQEAISDLNAEACRNFNRNQRPEPRKHA